ncbi:MAG: segregation and condensation protein segregation and condensation protein [Candidatus Parcubacteria bacterium]
MSQNLDSQSQIYGLTQHIEAILFWRGDPMSISSLAKITGAEKDEVKQALIQVKSDLASRGIVLIEHDGEYTLGTNPESAKLIEAARTEELSKDLGKAGLETLAIVLYQGPIRRSDIDYIRGVNSNFILRNLLIRGLIERKPDPKDSRASVYLASMELLRFLGLSHVEDLKDFEAVKEAIAQFKNNDAEVQSETSE